MEPIKNNLVLQRLTNWGIGQLQNKLGISRTMRLSVDPDNCKFWLRYGDGMRAVPNGIPSDRLAHTPIEATFNWETERAIFWVDDAASLIRTERQLDFDYYDLTDCEPGELNLEVDLTEAKELVEVWASVPPKPRPDGHGGMPNVTGLI